MTSTAGWRPRAGGQMLPTPPVGRVDCTVVTVTYNSEADIGGLLESIPAAAPGLSIRVVVVDNGSSDRTQDVVLRYFPDVTLIATGMNLGYAAGINVGRRHAPPSRALLIVNPDLRLEADAVPRLLEALNQPHVGIAVPTLLQDGRRYRSLRRDPSLLGSLGDALFGEQLRWRPRRLSEIVLRDAEYASSRAVAWATGAVYLVSHECDAMVGDWHEAFFLYSEEVEYAMRARRSGYQMQFVPAALASHRGGGSGSSKELAALMAVNKVRLFRRTHSPAAATLFYAIVILHHLLRSGRSQHRFVVRVLTRPAHWGRLDPRVSCESPQVRRTCAKGSIRSLVTVGRRSGELPTGQ